VALNISFSFQKTGKKSYPSSPATANKAARQTKRERKKLTVTFSRRVKFLSAALSASSSVDSHTAFFVSTKETIGIQLFWVQLSFSYCEELSEIF